MRSSMWGLIFLCAFAATKAQSGYSRDNPANQLGYNPFGQAISDDTLNGDEIPGEAGRDYPIYSEVPRTGFSCSNQQYPGYYADPEAQCQAYFICQKDGKGNGFLCPNGTVFNQEYLVCDWWYNFDCNKAEQLYSVNEVVVRAMEEADARLRLQQQQNGYNYNVPGSIQTQNVRYQNRDQNFNQRSGSTDDASSNRRVFNGATRTGQAFNERRGQSGYSQSSNEPNRFLNRNNEYSTNSEGLNANSVSTNQNFGISNTGNVRTNRPQINNSPTPSYRVPSNSIGGNAPGIQYSPSSGGNNYYRNFNGNRNDGFRNGNSGSTPDRTYLPPVDNNLNIGYAADGNDLRNGQQNYQTEVRIPDRTYLPPTGSGISNSSPSSQFAARRGNDYPYSRVNLSEPNTYNGISQVTSNNGYSAPDRRYLPPSK